MPAFLRAPRALLTRFRVLLDSAEGTSTPLGGSSPSHGIRPVKYEPQLQLMPISYSKTVHFIRHGEGFHNVGLNNQDAHLTPRGWEQAHALGRHMSLTTPCSGVQLVVVSPMMRALETAAGVFGEPLEEGGVAGAADDGAWTGAAAMEANSPMDPFAAPVRLMAAQTAEKNVRTAHSAAAARPGVLYVCHELCRERLGLSHCDRRRPRSAAALSFPGVDFSLVQAEEDAAWTGKKVESETAVARRGQKFLQWIMARPETNIAVVSHAAFLWFTLACFGNECARPVSERLQRWYENAEMRTVVLSDGGGMGTPDLTWFPGGETLSDPQRAFSETHTLGS